MSEKTFKLVHILYVLLITNIMSIIYLIVGLFSFSIMPVIYANINISILLFDDKIDGYSGIVKTFNDYAKECINKNKKSILIFGGYWLTIILSFFLMKRVNTPASMILNYLFIYLYIMIVIYWSFNFFFTITTKKSLKYIDGLVIMFLNIKKLLITFIAFAIFFVLSIMRKELLVIIFISLLSCIFVKINRPTIQKLEVKGR